VQAIENIQPDFFRYVFKTAGFNRSPTPPFLIIKQITIETSHTNSTTGGREKAAA
jgi:hypothetical protein